MFSKLKKTNDRWVFPRTPSSNSAAGRFAETDVLAVHAGYSRYRRSLVEADVKIYDMRPVRTAEKVGPRRFGESQASLHAKTIVFDRKPVLQHDKQTCEEAYAVRLAKLPRRWLAGAFVLVSILSLVFGLSVAMVGTQKDDTLDPNPLRTADTSSPRATLQSFLNSLGEVIDDQRQGQFSIKTGRGFLRAINTLDFSTTPNGDSWLVRTRRVLLLAVWRSRWLRKPRSRILSAV